MIKATMNWRMLIAAGLTLGWVGAASASQTHEQRCQELLFKAAGRYNKCQNKAHGLWSGGKTTSESRLRKCTRRYTLRWARLQSMFAGTGSTCDQPRFTDIGGVAVLDHLTGLTWEKKTAGGIQGFGTTFTWSASGIAPDGTAFTSLLATLNGACLAGTCDWRLPSSAELQTILLEPYLCTSSPCIVPELDDGLTAAGSYWAANTFSSGPTNAWFVNFELGNVYYASKLTTNTYFARAVRAGLLFP